MDGEYIDYNARNDESVREEAGYGDVARRNYWKLE
jgi:hypothetical protein